MGIDINQLLQFLNQNKQQGGFTPNIRPDLEPAGNVGIGGMVLPHTGMNSPAMQDPRAPATTAPPDANSRMNVWRDLLTNFVFSLGSGLEERAKYRHGGPGAALMGPFNLQQMRLKQSQDQELEKLRMAQEERTKVASDAAMQQIFASQQKLPAELQNLQARTGQTQANTADANARVPLIQAQTQQAQASTQNSLADVAQKQLIKVGDKVFKLSDLLAPDASNVKPLNGSTEEVDITITPAMAQNLGQPELSGKIVSAKVGAQLTSMISSATRITPTGTGVRDENLITGSVRNIGPPVSQGAPVSVLGPGGVPQLTTGASAIATGATPGRLSDTEKLTGQAASFSNFHSNAETLKSTLPALDQPGAASRISAAMAQLERIHVGIPGGIASGGIPPEFSQWLQGQLVTSNLKPDEYALVNALATMREDIFNLRQFFGNSPIRSNQQVQLMLNQLPGVQDLATGSSAMVKAKIENFERSVKSVESNYGPLMNILKNPQYQGPAKAPAPATPAGAEPDFIMQGGRMVPNPAKAGGR